FAVILKQFGVDRSRLANELAASLDQMKRGNSRMPSYTPAVVQMLSDAWSIGSLEYGAVQIRSGYAILALVSGEESSRLLRDFSKELQKIEPEALKKVLPAILEDSLEYAAAPAATATAATPGGAPRPGGKTPNLDQFTVDLTGNAKSGKIDTVLGRDF